MTGRFKLRRIGFWLAVVAGFFALLAISRILPGHAPNALYLLTDATFASCHVLSRAAGVEGCFNFAFPGGAPETFGLPISILASYLGPGDAVSLSGVLLVYGALLLVAYVGAILLFRRITGNAWVALLGAMLFLGASVVGKFIAYGPLGAGLYLIPFYLLVDLCFLDSLSRASRWKSACWFAAVLAVRYFAIFLDGYSFLFSCILSLACLFLIPLLDKRYRTAILASGAYAGACAIAVLAYRAYFPSDAMGATPLAGFRAQGVDVASLVLPQSESVYHRWFGFGGNVDQLVTYSDAFSYNGNFLGYAWIVAAVVIACFMRRRMQPGLRNVVLPILLVGLGALVLSLGPSLKYKSFRDTPATSVGASHYSMPASAAVADLPTAWAYQLPGIKSARGLVRWLVLVQLALALSIVLAVVLLLEHKRPGWAMLLAGLALLELVPNPIRLLDAGKTSYARAYTLFYDYPASLKRHVKPGERVLFLELHDNAGGNEYTVNTLCTQAALYCYNTGGDKNAVLAQRSWPPEIKDARTLRQTDIAVRRIFDKHLADVIVVPFFDLRNAGYSEGLGAVDIDQVVARTRALAKQVDMHLVVGDRFAYLRPHASAKDTQAPECSVSCWRSWPDLAVKAPIWGPRAAQAGQPINVQPDGRSLLWVSIADPAGAYSLALDDTLLATESNSTSVVTGLVPQKMIDAFVPGARYPLHLVDTQAQRKLFLGYIEVAGPAR